MRDLFLPTVAELVAMSRSSGRGATRRQLEGWGVAWPPPKGWLQRLLKEAREREGDEPRERVMVTRARARLDALRD